MNERIFPAVLLQILITSDGAPERVVDAVARMQRDGVNQRLIDRWLQGLERKAT